MFCDGDDMKQQQSRLLATKSLSSSSPLPPSSPPVLPLFDCNCGSVINACAGRKVSKAKEEKYKKEEEEDAEGGGYGG